MKLFSQKEDNNGRDKRHDRRGERLLARLSFSGRGLRTRRIHAANSGPMR